jgi:hypothetical protein
MATLAADAPPAPSLDSKAETTVTVDSMSTASSRTRSSTGSESGETSASSVASHEAVPTTVDAKKDGYTTYYPHPTSFKLGDHPIDEIRPMKVSSLVQSADRMLMVLRSLLWVPDSVDSWLELYYRSRFPISIL